MAERIVPPFTQERLQELLHYNPETGVFTWRVNRRKRKAGEVAGGVSHAYLVIGIQGRLYLAHRLAFLYMEGRWPDEVDHRDGQSRNNAWTNLREVDRSTNLENKRRANRSSVSGLMGAFYQKATGDYLSFINVKGKKIRVGRFKTAEEAHAAYLSKKRELHAGFTG